MKLQPRFGYLLGFLVCATLLGFAFYLELVLKQDPCPLCMLQRIVFGAIGLVFLVATLHGPARTGAIVYGTLLVLLAATGAGIAGRHVWLQSLPKHLVPTCGPGLEFIVERFPLAKALEMVLKGSGECAEKGWTFLGLTIAGWSLVWFVLLGLWAVYLARSAGRGGRR